MLMFDISFGFVPRSMMPPQLGSWVWSSHAKRGDGIGFDGHKAKVYSAQVRILGIGINLNLIRRFGKATEADIKAMQMVQQPQGVKS